MTTDPPDLRTLAADEKLVAELARATFERQGHTGWDEAEPSLRVAWLDEARWELDWLAERGRLVPDEASVCDELGTRDGVRKHRQVTTTPWAPAEASGTE